MLRFVIIFVIFVIVFHFVYKFIKRFVNYWDRELSNDTLFDQKNKIEQEREMFNENLKSAEKELKDKQKEISKLKKD